MSIPAVMKTMGLGVFASGAGLLASLYIVWIFGTDDFAVFTIANAKLSIVLLGLEFVPTQFSIFKMQHDDDFAQSRPTFYLAFAALASVVAAAVVGAGLIVSSSWLIVPYAFLAVIQRYIEVKTQASGIIPAFGRTATISSNSIYLSRWSFWGFCLPINGPLMQFGALCASGSEAASCTCWRRLPWLQELLIKKGVFGSVSHLYKVRREFYPYIVNSVLKRAKDTFIPLVVDATIPSRRLAGQVLVFFRASDAVCTQLRVLEMFLVNRELREDMKRLSRKLFFLLSSAGLCGDLHSVAGFSISNGN